MRWEGPPTCKTERSGKVKGTMGRGLGVKNEVRETEENPSAARVCYEGRGRRKRGKGRGRRGGECLCWRDALRGER